MRLPECLLRLVYETPVVLAIVGAILPICVPSSVGGRFRRGQLSRTERGAGVYGSMRMVEGPVGGRGRLVGTNDHVKFELVMGAWLGFLLGLSRVSSSLPVHNNTLWQWPPSPFSG